MKSNGPLKTVAAIRRAAKAAAAHRPYELRTRDMVALARRNPHAFLARPSWQRDLLEVAETGGWKPCYCGNRGWLSHRTTNRNCPRNA